jgi:beta-mannanase
MKSSVSLRDKVNQIGIYMPDTFESGLKKAMALEVSLGRKIGILSFYEAWGNGRRPDVAGIESCLRQGFAPMITWEPWRLEMPKAGQRPEDQREYSLAALVSGRYDKYITEWASDLKQLSRPIFLRPMHEMNGNWYPWCGKVNGNKPQDYIVAWRYIRSIFRETGSNSVMWVWSPYTESVPDVSDNVSERYFPCAEDVDWLALDGYNWGLSREWSQWQTFVKVFGESYGRLRTLEPRKPFMIAETGCAEEGGDKALWIQEAAEALRNRFPAVKALVWFNVNKECDWRIDSSERSLTGFRTHFNDW